MMKNSVGIKVECNDVTHIAVKAALINSYKICEILTDPYERNKNIAISNLIKTTVLTLIGNIHDSDTVLGEALESVSEIPVALSQTVYVPLEPAQQEQGVESKEEIDLNNEYIVLDVEFNIDLRKGVIDLTDMNYHIY